jgi:hypothetical protein
MATINAVVNPATRTPGIKFAIILSQVIKF